MMCIVLGMVTQTEADRMLARRRARRTWQTQPTELARLVRQRAGLTQDEIAALLGVDRSAVSRWEAGQRTPCAEILTRYIKLLDRLTHEREKSEAIGAS